jgi:coenzyme F420-reducing hydrogenase delta subunit
MRAFEKGADGVYVVGCREGDCHYNSGNFRAKKRVEQAKEILEAIGIGGNRVRMCNLSSSDGPLFAKYAEEMHDEFARPARIRSSWLPKNGPPPKPVQSLQHPAELPMHRAVSYRN